MGADEICKGNKSDYTYVCTEQCSKWGIFKKNSVSEIERENNFSFVLCMVSRIKFLFSHVHGKKNFIFEWTLMAVFFLFSPFSMWYMN